MKTSYLIIIFILITVACNLNQSGDSSINYKRDKNGDIVFKATSAGKEVDSMVVIGATDIIDTLKAKNQYLYHFKLRCGSGCKRERILILSCIKSKLHQSLKLNYLASDMMEANYLPFSYRKHLINIKENFFSNPVLNEILIEKNDTIYNEKVRLLFNSQKSIFYESLKFVNGNFYNDQTRHTIKLNDTIECIQLKGETIIFYNHEWLTLDMENHKYYFE